MPGYSAWLNRKQVSSNMSLAANDANLVATGSFVSETLMKDEV